MDLVKILSEPIQFPSIYDFTFILFGNSGEMQIHVRVFDDEAVKHAKHDLADAEEPKLLAKFKRFFKPLEIYLIEEYYQFDFDQEPVVFLKLSEDTDKEPNRIGLFICEDKKSGYLSERVIILLTGLCFSLLTKQKDA